MSPPPQSLASGPSAPSTLAASESLFVVLVVATTLLVLAALWRFDVIRPGSFRRVARRDTGGLPWWGWIVAAFATVAAMMLGQAVGASVVGAAGLTPPQGTPATPATGVIAYGFTYAAAIAAAIFLVVAIRRAEPKAIRRRVASDAGLMIRASDFFHGLGWFVLVVPVVWSVSIATAAIAAWYEIETDEIAHVTLRKIADEPANPWTWGVIVMVVVAGPVTEEFVYRVFFQSGLLALLGRPWLAITLASAFFAAAHYRAADWYALPSLAVFGFALGLAYERSRRLGVPIVMHALFNLANVGLVLHGVQDG